ncbi:DNA repair protein REV1 [Elsinoe australis]|uniref:DNA repair protein REV1 n=1 Tax=Elsinoe australis TaxID=40998 RepID=A0A2P7ZDG4_9PEZI|nr:DNA repair protein REV1 [Elsinoe australis]
MPPPPPFPIAAKPAKEIFDPWNSSSTGHQRAENRLSGSTSWRDSRTAKLSEQFRSGLSGGKRVADTVGAGSESFVRGERTANGGWKRGVVRDRASGQISLWESFGAKQTKRAHEDDKEGTHKKIKPDIKSEVSEHPAGGRNEQGRWCPVCPGGVCKEPLTPGLVKKRNRHEEDSPSEAEELTDNQVNKVKRESDDISRKEVRIKHEADRKSAVASPRHTTYPIRHRKSSVTTQTKEEIKPEADDFDDALLASFSPNSSTTHSSPEARRSQPKPDHLELTHRTLNTQIPDTDPQSSPPSAPTPPQIFTNLTIYINGSTYPLISDHKLRHLLATHGANLSISLGRRTVTHVILGIPSSALASSFASTPNVSGRGAGGALAAGKIQKEIQRVRSAGGKGVRYVSAEWVVECVRRGRRVPEGGYEVVATGGAGQKGVGGLFGKGKREEMEEAGKGERDS